MNAMFRNGTYTYGGNLTPANNRVTDGEVWIFVYDNDNRLTKVRENKRDIMAMAYAANGNITSKTGIGSYDYSTTTRPHAVTAVDNTSGILSMNNQTITYNSWGKASGVSQSDNTDSYSHSIVCGPDLQRVTSLTSKNNSTLYEKFYWDDYEERRVDSILYQYYYVYGSDGLAGLHIVKSRPSNQTSCTTKVITDHLGSILYLYESRRPMNASYKAYYDVWGKRNVSKTYNFDPYFDRGFTGHEHLLSEFGLINMNGRMYDPNLGRFLSPDNNIQSPNNPQNYNRYSYCLNNPLKYTDPDGEYWHLIIGGIIGGFTNWISHDCEFSWKGFWYFNVGALAGAASAAVGGGISSSLAGGSFFAGAAGTSSAMTAGSSFLNGVAIGGSSGFTSGFIAGTGNSIISGDNFSKALSNGWNEGLIEGSIAAFSGGLLGGINAARDGRRFWDGATVEKNIVDQSAFVTPSGQAGLKDCGPECVEIVDRSFGGDITAEDIRTQLGGNINENALGDVTTWKKYSEMSNHKFFAERSKTGRPYNVFLQMREGGRVAVNLNTGYINPSTGLPEGHSIVIQRATQKIVTRLNGAIRTKYIFKAVNPGFSGGSIERISIQQLNNAHNIFYIH
ncbi:MAG: hypothetical protein IKX55_05020 [Bacteroidaceae bacterium]|nr:hypothetical protein [Bacteroidaceae bacterium]